MDEALRYAQAVATGRGAGSAWIQLLKLLSPASSARLGVAQMRYLGRVFAVFRWAGGVGLVGLVAVFLPPKHPYWLALLIVWVAVYNGPLTLALNRADNASILGIVRIAAVIDMISYFALLAIFIGNPPGVLIAIYPAVLIESISFDGAPGAIYGVFIFIVGFAGLELIQHRFSGIDVILWACVMVIIATSMTLVSQVMLGAATLQVPKPSESFPEATRIGLANGVPRLSAREREVLKLVAEGYSNAMIASRLHLSENTVKGHVEALLTRLNARNRAEAVAAAGRLDLL